MVSRISSDAAELPAKDIAYSWEHRYWHALDNAKRCRRLARHIVTDERLCLSLQQLAADYETLAGWLRRH
jgi:hypothetical protein